MMSLSLATASFPITTSMHVTLFPEGLIILAVYVTVPIVLWRVSRRVGGWLRLTLRGAALTMCAVLLWSIFGA